MGTPSTPFRITGGHVCHVLLDLYIGQNSDCYSSFVEETFDMHTCKSPPVPLFPCASRDHHLLKAKKKKSRVAIRACSLTCCSVTPHGARQSLRMHTVEMTNAWIYTEQRNKSETEWEWEYCERVKFKPQGALGDLTQFSQCFKTVWWFL